MKKLNQRAVRAIAAATVLLLAGLARPVAVTRDFIWKVTGKQSVFYLVGSVHMLTKDYYPLNTALDTAFKDSDLLIEEVDLAEMLAPDSQAQVLSRAMLPEDTPLDKVVSPATYALVVRHVGDLGLPIEPLKLFKPWMLAMTLLQLEWQKAGFDAELGLDKHFYDRAHKDGKEVQGLETTEYQISLFDGM